MNTEARTALVEALVEATKPEKTGTFCFDGYFWHDKLPVLKMIGDHGTPSFTLTFLADKEGNVVNVAPDGYPGWDMNVRADSWGNYPYLAQQILAAMAVAQIRCGA